MASGGMAYSKLAMHNTACHKSRCTQEFAVTPAKPLGKNWPDWEQRDLHNYRPSVYTHLLP